MASRKLSGFILSLSLVSLVSCGGGSSSSKSSSSRSPVEAEENTNKLYRAILKPVNPNMASTGGVVVVRVDGDDFKVEQTVTDAPSGIRHFQAIMAGSSCAAVDENGDGYIDIVEGQNTFGKRLIPLDSNLDSQMEGSNFGPIANEANAYIYQKSTSLAKMISDLISVDPDDEDDLVKLPNDKSLALSSRVVVVMGVNRSLPSTVSGNGTYEAAEGFPIACGELVAIENENPEIE